MANKYRKIGFRLQKELIIIVAVLLVLLVAAILLNLPTKSEKFVSEWSEAGASIQDDSLFEAVSQKELKKLVEKNDKVFVLFVTSSDSDSVSLVNEVASMASNFNIDKVYILDSADYLGNREEDTNLDSKLKELENDLGIKESTQAPSLWMFEQHQFARQLNEDLHESTSGYTEPVKQVLVYNLTK